MPTNPTCGMLLPPIEYACMVLLQQWLVIWCYEAVMLVVGMLVVWLMVGIVPLVRWWMWEMVMVG